MAEKPKPNGIREDQLTAMRFSREMAKKVDPMRAVELFRQTDHPMSYRAIAGELLPEDASAYPDISRSAIQRVIHKNIPLEERRKLSKLRRTEFSRRTLKAHPEHQAVAAKARHDKGIPVNSTGIIEGRGLTRWTEGEKAFVLDVLLRYPDFQYPAGMANRGGKPNTGKIAELINRLFHEGKPIRTPHSVHEMIKHSLEKPEE